MLLVTAEEMREIDRQTIEGIGIPGIVLMENAGSSVAKKIKELVPNTAKVIILAGHGNNGGDGFVVARHLGNQGYDVETWLIGDIRKCSHDTLINFHALVHSGYKMKFWDEKNDNLLKIHMDDADVIVDALLGTGAIGELREPFGDIVQFANEKKALRIAVDMPTGVNSNTGEVGETVFSADYTITFALPKLGQFLYPGASYVGELIIADISIPSIIYRTIDQKNHLINHQMVKDLLPKRNKNSHKGIYGHALLLGGSKWMPGAPTLATLAALRIGAGLTTIAVPDSIQSMVFNHVPEAICLGLPETFTGYFALSSLELLNFEEGKYSAIGVGPGLGIWDEGRNWLIKILKSTSQPLVIDADGLNLLTDDLDLLKARQGPIILTPHPGEMARLLKKDTSYVEKNRVQAAIHMSITYKVYTILKGANTIIATPAGEIYLNTTGGPELAKGGTGDVLTGIITGLLAQKLEVKDAIILGVYLHGLAGSLASSPSNYSTLASDVIDKIGSAIQYTLTNHA